MQQLIWTDKKAIICFYFPPTQYERDYVKWLMELDAARNIMWLNRNIYS